MIPIIKLFVFFIWRFYMIKKSSQRDAILTFLMSRTDHPTAKTIYDGVKDNFPRISLGTVYRNLALLEELGQVVRISCNDDKEHYDANTSVHYHFYCKKCKRVDDLDLPPFDFVETLATNTYGGEVHGHQLIFQGLCPDCKNG